MRPALAVLAVLLGGPALAQPQPEPLRVTSPADDGPGTLRWAIARANAEPGRYRIEIGAEDGGPIEIRPANPLPPLRGPLRIEGTAWALDGRFSVLDGSAVAPASCPGETQGQSGPNVRTLQFPGLAVVDTERVEIAGLEIRRFCIGVLLHRSSRNTVRDSRLVANHGGAGIMLTGDDGRGGQTLTTTSHNRILRNDFLDNGDGLELTRGASFNIVADNVFRSTAANPEPSQGIEVLLGHDNVIARNRFQGYSDGVQINSGDRNDLGANVFEDNTFGVSLTGHGNTIAANVFRGNAVAVAVRPTAAGTISRLSRNVMVGNGAPVARCWVGGSCDPALRRGAIVFGLPSGEHAAYVGHRSTGVPVDPARLARICPDGAPDCQAPPNEGIAAPVIERVSRQADGRLRIEGRIAGAPSSRHEVELFGNADAATAEAEVFLGSAPVATGADGTGRFVLELGAEEPADARAFTATVTTPTGATSPLSAAARE
ncbi:right-handed parallel beta-helix repeat-containing protein [Falsiroseomonas sp. HW251]|uniref:right-handed parallel beta-helix repeat-containing protein n=1 Tax=Falsiroseomonas sp. HW251 TaxID=3390998 RepID=UPI003D320527